MAKGTPVVFIHGLWLPPSSWGAWVELFREAGYDPVAPPWPGDSNTVAEAREHPERIAGVGVTQVAKHFADIVGKLPEKPVIIGHSTGGLIVQALLGHNLASAAVAIDSAQPKGVLPLPLAQLKAIFPVIGNPANLHKAVMLTPEQFRYGFTNTLTDEESAELYDKWAVPAPGRPIFEAAVANLHPHASTKVETANQDRCPLLLIAGGKDHTVPESIIRSTKNLYRHSSAVTDLKIFPDRGHSLTLDHGWRDVAQYTLDWLDQLPAKAG